PLPPPRANCPPFPYTPLFRSLLVRDVVPLGAADRAEQDRVGLPAQLERARRQRAPGRVDGGAADERLLELERDARAGVAFEFEQDRKSTRLNSSHVANSYPVF